MLSYVIQSCAVPALKKTQMVGFPAVEAGMLFQTFVSSGQCSLQGRIVLLVG